MVLPPTRWVPSQVASTPRSHGVGLQGWIGLPRLCFHDSFALARASLCPSVRSSLPVTSLARESSRRLTELLRFRDIFEQECNRLCGQAPRSLRIRQGQGAGPSVEPYGPPDSCRRMGVTGSDDEHNGSTMAARSHDVVIFEAWKVLLANKGGHRAPCQILNVT